MIYTEFKKKLISEFELKRDLLVLKSKGRKLEPLFGIKSDNDKLYMDILSAFETIAIQNVENLVAQLCEVKGVARNPRPESFDVELMVDGERVYFDFRTQPFSMDTANRARLIGRIQAADAPVKIVFLLKDGVESQRALQIFEEKTGIECMLFEAFLGEIFGKEEEFAFATAMANFKEEMHKVIGYQITELCSPHNLANLKMELNEELKNFDYESIKANRFAVLVANGEEDKELRKKNFDIIKNVFINNGRYKLLLGNGDFAESFLTSEWLYKKYFMLEELDNTFIVAGYLKSIEQLLWDIIFMVGKGRKIRKVTIDENNKNVIDKTLGALQSFMSNWSNTDLFQGAFEGGKAYVRDYLAIQISDWRNDYRNGYFHKHALKEKARIDAIREETFFLYFLILGAVRMTPEQVKKLG